MAFRGTFEHTLDAKNRLTVPAKFRAVLSDGAVLAKGIEPCVALWTQSGYEAYMQTALASVNPLAPEARKLRRYFAANAVDIELDSAGRVMVPAFLLEHGGLGKECVVTGAEDCLEIWDRRTWAAYNAELTTSVPDITAALGHAS
jgi:MraZ protein